MRVVRALSSAAETEELGTANRSLGLGVKPSVVFALGSYSYSLVCPSVLGYF